MPDLDDILDDVIEQELYLPHEMLDHEAMISKKKDTHAYSVDRKVVNAKAYHDKFEQLPVKRDVQQELYKQAGRLLEFVDNLPAHRADEERLIAVASDSGKLVVDNLGRDGENSRTGFTQEEYEKIQSCGENIVLLHNHPDGDIPSYQDLKTYYESDMVDLSLILGHDGVVYAICHVSEMFLEQHDELFYKFSQGTNDKDEAKRLATTAIYKRNEKLPESKKLFNVKKF